MCLVINLYYIFWFKIWVVKVYVNLIFWCSCGVGDWGISDED